MLKKNRMKEGEDESPECMSNKSQTNFKVLSNLI